jgi:hypothetical protein
MRRASETFVIKISIKHAITCDQFGISCVSLTQVLAGILKGRWMMPSNWLLDSHASGRLLPEGELEVLQAPRPGQLCLALTVSGDFLLCSNAKTADHGGSRLRINPFEKKALAFSPHFLKVRPRSLGLCANCDCFMTPCGIMPCFSNPFLFLEQEARSKVKQEHATQLVCNVSGGTVTALPQEADIVVVSGPHE